MTTQMQIDEAKVEQFLGQVVSDVGAAASGLLVYVGDQLGLYTALATAGPLTPEELATKTGTNERLVREWLSNQAAGGYVTYEPADGTFTLPPEHALVLAYDDTPVAAAGVFQILVAAYRSADKATEAFRTGSGLGWEDHHPELFEGVARFLRPLYETHLVSEWIPALDGVEENLRRGARVADIACGHGLSTIILAKAYPASSLVGSDFHRPSIERARKLASDEGVADRVRFEVASATEFSGENYDLIAFFDCFHDLGDPEGAAKRARSALAPDGTLLLVEPFANDRLEDNLNPLGRMFYAGSTLLCSPCSLDQGGPALGAQAGEARLREIFEAAGFSRFHRAAETPFNLVFEVRP